jgi:hypothetical protein
MGRPGPGRCTGSSWACVEAYREVRTVAADLVLDATKAPLPHVQKQCSSS